MLIKLFVTLSLSFSVLAIPIVSTELHHDQGDLISFGQEIKPATIVGLGESAHGVSKYIKIKNRLSKFLIEKYNFRLILLESKYVNTKHLSNYLEDCFTKKVNNSSIQLSALSKLRKFFFHNEETVEFINWLCTFNINQKKDPVVIHGIDVWEKIYEVRASIKAEIENRKDHSSYSEMIKLFNVAYKHCQWWSYEADGTQEEQDRIDEYYSNATVLPIDHIKCKGSLHNLRVLVNKNFPADQDSNLLIHQMIIVSGFYQEIQKNRYFDFAKAMSARDEAQAYLTLSWINKYKNSKKTILNMHNVHISKKQSSLLSNEPGGTATWNNVVSAGERLSSVYGHRYKSIGITGYNISGMSGRRFPVQFPVYKNKDSLDYVLSEKFNLAFLKTKNAQIFRDQKKWWMHNEVYPLFLEPAQQYDGIIFVRESSEAKLLNL